MYGDRKYGLNTMLEIELKRLKLIITLFVECTSVVVLLTIETYHEDID